MSTKILIKRSSTAGSAPTTSDIATGELAVNTVDKRIFTNNAGTIVELGTYPSTQAVQGNATVGGTLGVTGATTLSSGSAATWTVTGTLTVPTPTNSTDAASKGYVDAQVSSVIDSAPSALNTLNELAAALNDDANFATTVTNALATKLALAGGTMTGNIVMGANSITSTATPATADTLTRKGYVDGLYQSTVDAEVSAAAAAASATAAAGSASSASTSATTATTQASAASTSATSAASSATAAATSATSSANSATASATSATQSAASATQAQALVDSIESFYLGAEASAPTVDDNGDPLQAGDWYFNTTDSQTYIYNGSSWQSVSPDLVSDLTPQLGGNLDTNGNDINFGDNDKAIFGAGSDLQIYHDGNNSFIRDVGTGNLKIQANNLELKQYAADETYISALANSGVYLYYDNAIKLATTSTGIDVTGTATMDGLTVAAGDGNLASFKNSGANGHIFIIQGSEADDEMKIRIGADTSTYSDLVFSLGAGAKDSLRIADNNDISFYEDTGTTAKFFWDASAESLGIGTSSPSGTLEVRPANSDTPATIARFQQYNAVSSDRHYLDIKANTADNMVEFISSGTNNGGYSFGVVGAERMRIDSSGNLLVGKTVSGLNTVGLSLLNNGAITATASGVTAAFDRKTTDGDIVQFYKDEVQVGSIGTINGSPYVTGTAGGLRLLGTEVRPVTSAGVNYGDATDLGNAGVRFKDLYLSGGVYLGGTGSANYLDDYEEGTWTCTMTPSSGFTPTSNTTTGFYTKVGNMVTVWVVPQMSVPASLGSYVNNSTSFSVSIDLPFAITSGGVGRRSAPTVGVNAYLGTNAGVLTGHGNTGTSTASLFVSKDDGTTRRSPVLTVNTTANVHISFSYFTN